MKISASAEYAARMMVQLARLEQGGSLSAEKLSTLENIPRAYVDQIFQRLRHAGLVQSVRGPHGGYALAKSAKEISIGMMMRAVEGHIFEDVCGRYASGELQCSHAGGCDIKPVWQRLTTLVEGFLDKVTIDDLLHEPKAISRAAHKA
ncbi:MAG: Rrf2 family transcriptional regulator [Elusimicrobia bacterium]|nr:Rrf2 family transcriptional regulator [Elusimicrobiota bacterium]